MNSEHKISVIIPAYNVSEYIEKSINSVLNQTFTHFELIIINDGSTDNTEAIISKFTKDPRVLLINQQNQGISGARNSGIAKAKGTYVFFLDGDDWIEPQTLQVLYDLSQELNADAIINNIDHFSEKVTVHHIAGPEDPLRNMLNATVYPSVCGNLYRRSIWKEKDILFPQDVSIGEDLITSIQVFYYFKNIKYMRSGLYHYARRSTSLMCNYNTNMFDVFKVIEHIKSFLRDQNLLERYVDEVEYLEFLHTYYFRIMIDVKATDVQKQIYDRARPQLAKSLNNRYVIKYIDQLSCNAKNTFWLFNRNYYLGRLKMLLLRYLSRLKSFLAKFFW